MDVDSLREKYKGRNIVICGSAPSLNDYVPIEDAVHLGLNKAVLYERIPFELMVSVDYTAIYSIERELKKREELIKFFGRVPEKGKTSIPEKFFMMKNVIAFDVADTVETMELKGEFTRDISIEAIRYYQSVATVAIQIALYMKPCKIYLVGLDFSSAGHFLEEYDTEEDKNIHKKWAKERWKESEIRMHWRAIAEFAEKNYPETEIISVNPVALKGIFFDMYIK